MAQPENATTVQGGSGTGRQLTVLAMGGHSLLDPDLPPTVDVQFATAARAMRPVADLVERGEPMVLVHGNGPQVGFMQLRSELASQRIHAVPLDSLVADTQGSLGYMIQRALRQELRRRGQEIRVATVVTEVVVDRADRAFREPTKPIGRFLTPFEAEARRRDGWKVLEEPGRGWRRVVASPGPVEIVQLEIIRFLLASSCIVIACGGGGIPVTRDAAGELQGLECVIDKDRTSALLAINLGASRLVITTGVDAVYRDYGTPRAQALRDISLREIRRMWEAGEFPAGSMGPKIEAAVYYLERGGESVVICEPGDLVAAFAGQAGTTIRRRNA